MRWSEWLSTEEYGWMGEAGKVRGGWGAATVGVLQGWLEGGLSWQLAQRSFCFVFFFL